MPLFTVGHGTRSIDELAAVLTAARVETLVDVRRYPASRRHPQFTRAALEVSLPEHGVAYEWWGESLGGRRRGVPRERSRHPAWRDDSFRAYAEHMDTAEFRTAFDALLARARSEAIAVMCAETVWWRCHRRLIADAAVAHGVDVMHLGLGAAPVPHHLDRSARRGDDGWPVYDLVQQELLGEGGP